jgi:hypothetical protein
VDPASLITSGAPASEVALDEPVPAPEAIPTDMIEPFQVA